MMNTEENAIHPRYGHVLVPAQGRTYHIATDKPPAYLAQFWSDVNFACGKERITDLDACHCTGNFGYPGGSFSLIKWRNVLSMKVNS